MLNITRKQHQAFHVGDARIVVLEIANGRVKFGIEAPQDCIIRREEVIHTGEVR